MTAPEDGTHEADAPVVDVVIANHDLRRPVTRAVASALAGRTAVRVTVVAHHLRADDMRAALGALGDDPRVRVLEFSDGVPSPAGPMNVGIRAGSAPYVMLLGSDDYLEPGTIDRWVEAARAFGSDYLIGPQRDLNGRSLRDPLTRRGRLTALDAGRDRLAYRLALFGLIRREYLDRLGIMLSEGVATGEDIELSLALVTRGGVVSYDPSLPGYVLSDEEEDRVTTTSRPASRDLEALTRLRERPWIAALEPAARTAVAVMMARFILVPAVLRRPEPEEWSATDADAVADVAAWLSALDPRGLASLSIADHRVLAAASARDPRALVAAAERHHRGPRWTRAITASPLAVFAVDSPLRRAAILVRPAPGDRPSAAGPGVAPGPGSPLTPTQRGTAAARSRGRLPSWANRVIEYVADHPASIPGRIAALRFGRVRPQDVPPPTAVPDAAVRVYIGPVNYSEQGYAWARALESADPRLQCRNMSVVSPGGYAFRADTEVPVAVYQRSRTWQRAQLDAVRGFTHVLVEAEKPLFGRLFLRDVAREADILTAAGVSTAYMAHGTDVRLPSRHATRTVWSPYRDTDIYLARHEIEAERNIALLTRLGRPTFVSTPDLLADLPFAHWCPVVVDVDRWRAPDRPPARAVPVVAHLPTNPWIKGTDLIRPALRRLHDRGVIEYREITAGVPSAQMPATWADADIVLDQFRLGSYGVAACEAMAAGAVVVGHVLEDVRRTVEQVSGIALPLVEADPDTIEEVVLGLATDPERRARLGVDGAAFVATVHDGRISATVLREQWIRA
ncbi:MAG: glycosyltransferase [Microbacterium sp.]|uniref:glycosyltransferase n=2 Tax=Microbacterium sp. TaxID=51671 RepID=UPI001AD27AF5|nr:glycosyltransferase [Microbacterium sp.]MBN9154214.1 glycosyltransferase [Microbacterium sp.]